MHSKDKAIERQQHRKLLADSFPEQGNVSAKEAAAFLVTGYSTFFRYVKNGLIEKAIKLGANSLWNATYIRSLNSKWQSTQKAA